MKNDEKQTYFGRAQVDVEAELGGRWAKPKPLMGGQVPQQPEGSPWASDPVGKEEPLGYSVDEVQPVGEQHEIEASLRAIEDQQQRSESDE